MRSFQGEWFKKFDWLEYSQSKDVAYCFHCFLFKSTNVGRFGDEVFTKKGFKNWKKGLEKLRERVGGVNSVHHEVRIQFKAFKN